MKFAKIVVTLTPHLGPSLNFACLSVNIVDHYTDELMTLAEMFPGCWVWNHQFLSHFIMKAMTITSIFYFFNFIILFEAVPMNRDV